MDVFIDSLGINLVKASFSFLAFLMVFIGFFVNWCEQFVPVYILECYRYSKYSYKGPGPRTIQVPKKYVVFRWFRHFYIFSSVISSAGFILLFSLYFGYIKDVPYNIRYFINLVAHTKNPSVSAPASLLAMMLLTVHCMKRLYESHCVSIFSNITMHIGVYMVGFAHYLGAVVAILCEAPGIAKGTGGKAFFLLKNVSFLHLFIAVIFLWATKAQFDTACLLANLRKNKNGDVVSQKHKIPLGGYFQYLSSPHLVFEIIVYLCLAVILWANSTWVYVSLWVTINQIECCLLNHWWYQQQFKNYPKNRKALIPYVF